MSIAFAIRATLLMTLMPQADARHVMGTLLGDLLAVPWRRAHAVASRTVLSRWRTAIGPAPLQQLNNRGRCTNRFWVCGRVSRPVRALPVSAGRLLSQVGGVCRVVREVAA